MAAFTVGPRAYVAPPCVMTDWTTPRLTTAAGVEYVQTPDSAFAGLAAAGFPFTPKYATVEGMRMAYVDEGPRGARETLLLLHGQPSWSFLYRKMIPVFVGRGYRVIAVDNLGMGRSDKPTSLEEHTYAKHVARTKAFIRAVLPEVLTSPPLITPVVQDWGSLFGMRVVADEPAWFRRLVVANGRLPVAKFANTNPTRSLLVSEVNYDCSDTRSTIQMFQQRRAASPCAPGPNSTEPDPTCFSVWQNYCLTNPSFTPGLLMRVATAIDGDGISAAEAAMYASPPPRRRCTMRPTRPPPTEPPYERSRR